MRQRARRWAEAAAVLLAFPLAVGLTVVAISSPADSRGAATPRVATASVSITGHQPVPTYALADRLASIGFRVTSVDVSDGNSLSDETVVVYYERHEQAAAMSLRDLLGAGTVRRDEVIDPVTDLTIILGKDLQHT